GGPCSPKPTPSAPLAAILVAPGARRQGAFPVDSLICLFFPPAERAGALVEPGVLGRDPARARQAMRENRHADEESRIEQVARDRPELALGEGAVQATVNEAQKAWVNQHLPVGAPGDSDRAAGGPGGETHHDHRDDDGAA